MGCSTKKVPLVIKIPDDIISQYEQEELFCNTNLCLIYYFDGNCSLCYTDILSIEDSYNDIKKLYINYGGDTLVSNLNIEQLKLEYIDLHYDMNNNFYTENINLPHHHIFLINSSFDVLESSINFNEQLKNKIKTNNH